MINLFAVLLSPAFIWVLYDALFYLRPVYQSGCGIYCSMYYFILAMDLFCLILILIFYAIFVRKLTELRIKQLTKGAPAVIYGALFLLQLAFLLYLVNSVFGGYNLLQIFGDNSQFYALSMRGTAWVYMIMHFINLFMLYDIYRSNFEASKIGFFLGALFLLALTGGRSGVILEGLFLLFLYVVVDGNKLPWKYVLVFLLLGGGVFIGNAIIRTGGDFAGYLEGGATQLDFDSSFVLNSTLRYLAVHGPSYLVGLDDFYYFFVPRSISPDKPMSTAETRLLFPDVAEWGTNYTIGYYANILINFGEVGLLITPFFLFLYNYLYFRMIISRTRGVFTFLMLFLSFYSLQVVRGGLINARFLIFIISILAAGIAWKALRFVAASAVKRRGGY